MSSCCTTPAQCLFLTLISVLPFCLYIVIVIYNAGQLRVAMDTSTQCPLGTFSCDVSSNSSSGAAAGGGVCIEQQFWCDGVVHCPNGEDEELLDCYEREQNAYSFVFETQCYHRMNRERINCSLQSSPSVCTCINSIINCNRLQLVQLPSAGFSNLSNALKLEGNLISRLNSTDFSPLPNLNLLDLSGNKLLELEVGVFDTVPYLKTLRLSHNQLTVLPAHTFRGLRLLSML